ncbi:MAG: hypothetical protein JXQ29_10975 [Planctomycetes bacterium]|nr:hypothetical protein [Planctomycetota bacterium]
MTRRPSRMRRTCVCLMALYALAAGGVNLGHTCTGPEGASPESAACGAPCCLAGPAPEREAPCSGTGARVAAGSPSSRVHSGPCLACLFIKTGQADRIVLTTRRLESLAAVCRTAVADPVPARRPLHYPARPRAPPCRTCPVL